VRAANLAQARRDPSLGVGVDRGRRLDEDEHLGVGEYGAREAQSLALSTRETPASLFDQRVETVLQRVEDVQ